MRRQAQYLYVAELYRDARVLEVPCGTGHGARFLAEHGARHVIAVDPSAEAIAEARREHSLTNLELRCEDPRALELDDGAIDCVVVPDAATVLRRRSVLDELRRVLAPDGSLVVAATSAERGGGAGGVSYHELVDRLATQFGPVHMVAQTPVSGWALIGYSDEPGVAVDEVVLDRTLVREAVAVTDYLAICSGAIDRASLAAYTLFQEPPRTLTEVEPAVGLPLEARPTVELPAVDVDVESRPTIELPAVTDAELEARPTVELPAVDVEDRPTVEMPAVTDDEVAAVVAEAGELEAARAEAESLRAALAAAEQRNRDLVGQLDQVRERATRAEEEVDTLQSELEDRIAEAAARASAEQALADSDELEAALTREEERRAGLERSLEEAETARAELEAKISESELAVDEMRAALFEIDPSRAARVETKVRDRVDVTLAVRRVCDDVTDVRRMLDELTRGIAELADAHLESGGASEDEQLRGYAIELGVKDAELTLLNIGLSSVQDRMRQLVSKVRETREAMDGHSAAEMLEMMLILERSLAESTP